MAFLTCTKYANAQIKIQHKIEKLAGNINSPYEETKPYTSAQGDTLFFIRSNHPENIGGKHSNEDIWHATKLEDNSWLSPTNLLPGINDAGANIFAGIKKDGNGLYLFEYNIINNKRSLDIVFIDLNTGEKIVPVNYDQNSIRIDDEFHDVFLHPNEKILIISMNAMNTMGLEDLYISLKDENDIWGRPTDMGSIINTRGFEISPFLSDDCRTLYFSSNRPDGFGDADLYSSQRIDDSWRNWSKPKNMGRPFNSSKFDAYLFLNQKGEFFISSNRNGEFADIYKIIKKSVNRDSVEDLKITSSASSNMQQSDYTDNPDMLHETFSSNPMVLFFPFDQFHLESDEYSKLENFIHEKLMDSAVSKYTIIGYTDDTGSESYNQKLSLKRAKAISKIMRKAGIDKGSLVAVGNGVFPTKGSSPEQKRRVEIRNKIGDSD